MNLYLVKRRNGVRTGQKSAMVVRERTEDAARVLAQCNAGREGGEAWARGKVDVTRIPTSGKAEIILAAHEPSSLVTSLRRMRMPMSRRGMLATVAQAAMG
jgi:hypothetical protein